MGSLIQQENRMIKYALYFSFLGLVALTLAVTLAFFLPWLFLPLLNLNRFVISVAYDLCRPYVHPILNSTITGLDSVHTGMIELARSGSGWANTDPSKAEAILRVFSFEFGLLVLEMKFLLLLLINKMIRAK